MAMYLILTNPKGISSVPIGHYLSISTKSAWHLAHHIRESMTQPDAMFAGPVEADEPYFGGRWRGRGRGPQGKAVVFGIRDRATGQVFATPVSNINRKTLHGLRTSMSA